MACKISHSAEDMFYVGRSAWKGSGYGTGDIHFSMPHPVQGVLSVIETAEWGRARRFHILWREDGRKGFAHGVLFADEMDPINDGARSRYHYDWDLIDYKTLEAAKAAIHAYTFLFIPEVRFVKRKTDSKRECSYRFESLFCKSEDPSYFAPRDLLSIEQARAEIEFMATSYSSLVKPPNVKFHNLGKTTAGDYGWNTIRLNSRPSSGGTSRAVTTHELAHHIVDTVADSFPFDDARKNLSPHGPEFLGILIDLYAQFHGLNRAKMESGARALGLEVSYAYRPTPEIFAEAKKAREAKNITLAQTVPMNI